MKIRTLHSILAVLFFCNASSVQAKELEWKKKSVTVEYVTQVFVATFPTPLQVKLEKLSLGAYFTPEGASIAQFSAMARGDYDSWLAGWSKESRESMLKRYAESGRKPSDITAPWKGLLVDKQVYLLGEAQYSREGKSYALVRYRMTLPEEMVSVDKATGKTTKLGKKDFESTLVFRKSQEKWEAVQDLASDPVFGSNEMLWDATKSEIRITRPAP